MEFLPIGVVNGINFAEYVPCEKGYNTIVYVHRSVLEKQKDMDLADKEKGEKAKKSFLQKFKRVKTKEDKENKKKSKPETADKCVQFSEKVLRHDVYSVAVQNDPILEHTIQVAKNIVPLVIKNTDDPTVWFTVKTKKSKKKQEQDTRDTKQDIMYKKEKSKRVIETYKNEKMMNQVESTSVKEVVSFSSSTLDEVPLSFGSYSEMSEKKHRKKEHTETKPKADAKILGAESFEAIAHEALNNSGDAKVKVHLMNDTEKSLLADNIRIPVLNAIRDCISEIIERTDYSNKGLENLQRFMKSNTEKIDGAMYRLNHIEQKLDYIIKEITKPIHFQPAKCQKSKGKVSTLEQLGEDIEDDNSYEENYYSKERPQEVTSQDERRRYDYEAQKDKERKQAKAQSNVVPMSPRIAIETIDKGHETGGCGEDQPNSSIPPMQLLAPVPDRPNRIPARFCWTDSTRHD